MSLQTVEGSETLTVPAAQAGKGRCCWTTWPVFDDPDPAAVGMVAAAH